MTDPVANAPGPKAPAIIGQIVHSFGPVHDLWEMEVVALRDAGELARTDGDVDRLTAAVLTRVLTDDAPRMKETLLRWAWPMIATGLTSGLADWYLRDVLGTPDPEPFIGTNPEAPILSLGETGTA